MNIKKVILLWILLGGFLPLPLPSCSFAAIVSSGDGAVKVNSTEEALYADVTRAINESRWTDAEGLCNRVIQQHGVRAEGALYWKAYAENKEGRPSDALNTCGELRKLYSTSRWLEECGALEIEIRGQSGQPVQPQSEPNDDLKLLALNSLMHHDEARAMPIVMQILKGNASPKLKERALFVLAQSNSKDAQDLLLQITKGQTDPELQVKAIQMFSVMKGKQSTDMFADIYRNTNNDQVKKAVLEAYFISKNSDKLLEAARRESNPKLVREAISELGALGSVSDLLSLYRETPAEETKASILNAFVASGKKGEDALNDIVASEQNPSLQRKAIRNLGAVGRASATPALLAAYQKSSDVETKKAAVEALFLAQDAHDLVTLARAEKDPALKQIIVRQLSIMRDKEASDYMLEILEK